MSRARPKSHTCHVSRNKKYGRVSHTLAALPIKPIKPKLLIVVTLSTSPHHTTVDSKCCGSSPEHPRARCTVADNTSYVTSTALGGSVALRKALPPTTTQSDFFTFRSQFELSSKLDGLRSRWSTFDECMYLSARSTCSPKNIKTPYRTHGTRRFHYPVYTNYYHNSEVLLVLDLIFWLTIIFLAVIFLAAIFGRTMCSNCIW